MRLTRLTRSVIVCDLYSTLDGIRHEGSLGLSSFRECWPIRIDLCAEHLSGKVRLTDRDILTTLDTTCVVHNTGRFFFIIAELQTYLVILIKTVTLEYSKLNKA